MMIIEHDRFGTSRVSKELNILSPDTQATVVPVPNVDGLNAFRITNSIVIHGSFLPHWLVLGSMYQRLKPLR